MKPLLSVRGLSKSFGGLAALRELDFDVQPGQIVGLIGPNGAGKTTAFNCISGTLRPSQGSVRFDGREIAGLRASAVVQLGLARTFQSTSIYPAATVRENVYRGALSRLRSSLLNELVGGMRTRERQAALVAEADAVILRLGLAAVAERQAGGLSYGQQKRLGVAIGLATQPRLLLLDEPAAGLNPEESAAFGRLLRELRDEMGLTLLLVEHHMALVMDLCEHIVVLVQGAKLAEGTPRDVRDNPEVVQAYLGTPEDSLA